MNTTKGEALHANIYQACNDEYKKGVVFNREKLIKSSSHSVKVKGDKLDVIIDKDADDIDEIFQSKGTSIPPDELLDFIKTSSIKIPIKHREGFSQDMKLPPSDLLKVLHYYASKKMTASPTNRRLARTLDETALLSFGLMVEQWVDDIIDENSARLFLEGDDDGYDKSSNKEDDSEISESANTGSSSSSDSDLSDDSSDYE